jgi:hypothetical protein
MTVVELVEKLKASHHRGDAIARVIGYVVMIQRLGWENLPVNQTTRYNLKSMFKSLDVDPFAIEV